MFVRRLDKIHTLEWIAPGRILWHQSQERWPTRSRGRSGGTAIPVTTRPVRQETKKTSIFGWQLPYIAVEWFFNPLRTIGSQVTHKNWPMNWPDFCASPALLGWPTRNRHNAACIHQFSHILRRPPVPIVWFMSESRLVANEHEGHKRAIPIISSSFWRTVVLKGLYQGIFYSLFNEEEKLLNSTMKQSIYNIALLILFEIYSFIYALIKTK